MRIEVLELLHGKDVEDFEDDPKLDGRDKIPLLTRLNKGMRWKL